MKKDCERLNKEVNSLLHCSKCIFCNKELKCKYNNWLPGLKVGKEWNGKTIESKDSY